MISHSTPSQYRPSQHRLRVAALLLALGGCGGAVGAGGAREASSPTASPETSTTSGAAQASFVEAEIFATHGVMLTAMPTAVTSFGAATLDGHVYVAGGYHGAPHDYHREGQSAELARFSISGGWEPLAPMERGLQGLAMVAYRGDIVRCGGSVIANSAGEPTDMRAIADCARYSPETGAWTAMAPMPEARSSFDAAVARDRVYFVGGWQLAGAAESTSFGRTTMVLEGETWRALPQPFTRRGLAVAATSRRVVAIGGLEPGSRSPTRAVSILDLEREQWASGPELPAEPFGVAAVGVGDSVYASGRDGVVWRLRDGQSRWERVASMAEGRFFHRLVSLDEGSLVALGGIGSMTPDGRARLVESIPLTASDPSQRIGWVDIGFPGDARNRSSLFVEDDSLFVLGGNTSTEQHEFRPENFSTAALRLHVPSLRWYALEPLAEGRQSMAIATHDGIALALGGFGHDEDAPRTYADAFVHGPGEGALTMLRDVLPLARTQTGLVRQDDALWVFAGLEYDQARPHDTQFVHLDSVLRCPVDEAALADPARRASAIGACEDVGAPLPGTRRAFASVAHGGRLYVLGGMREGFAAVDDCLVFDFATRAWSPFACPSRPRVSADLVAYDGRLYLAGGSSRTADGLAADRSIEVFDPATAAWSTHIAELPFDTHQARFVVHEHRLWMLSLQARAGAATLAWIPLGT